MPSGVRHTQACGVVAATSAATLLFVGQGALPALACGAGALVGIVLSPDLDVDSGNVADYYIRRYAGKIVEKLWDIFWWPYRNVLPHRGFWSHFPVLSTVIRLCYIYVLVILPVKLVVGFDLPHLREWMLWGLLGLIASDAVHWLLDWADSKLGGRL